MCQLEKMMLVKLPAFIGPTLIAVFLLTRLVHAHPIWNIFNTRNSIDSLVTDSSVLLAGGVKFGVPYYLTTPSPSGSTGNLTVSFLSSRDEAPLFFVHTRHLFHYTNDSDIFHVNVLNVTGNVDEPLPYKLILENKHDGLLDATWRWRGAFLHVDHGEKTNNGLYYMCLTRDGREGVYTSFDLISPPKGCKVVTLHSFGTAANQPKQRPLFA